MRARAGSVRRAIRRLGGEPAPPVAGRDLDQRLRRVEELAEALAFRVSDMRPEIDGTRLALGALHARLGRLHPPRNLRDAEFQVFSQWGEDGIIQHLVNAVDCRGAEKFVEIGVENYRESNTRFLLMHDNWRGVIVDQNDDHERFLTDTALKWRYDITPVTAFVTADSVNDVLAPHVSGDVGLLSIDIDGNDYWVFEALHVIRPLIVVLEYNSTFGPDARVSVPYDPAFDISRAHWSWLYFGASLAALTHLAKAKGYELVGCSNAGANAFFVRRDALGDLPVAEPAAAWRPSLFRISRDRSGNLSYLSSHAERLALISDMPVVVVPEGVETTVGEAVRPR